MATITRERALEEFKTAAFEAGLIIKGDPIPDGKIHRVPVEGSKASKTSGSYLLHLDDNPVGKIHNFQEDIEIHWKASGFTRALSSAEIREAISVAEQEEAQREKERLATELDVASRSAWRWNHSQPAESHPYLERKGVDGDGLRVDRYGNLLVPMQDVEGKLWGIQSINADGAKFYKKGARKVGSHAVLGEIDPAKPLLIAEGVATAKTVHRATGLPVRAAFDSGNLKTVAQAYREKYPDLKIGIASDNDHQLPLRKTATGRQLENVGVVKAEAAAKVVSGFVLTPEFQENDKGSDWNDYEAQHGPAKTKQALIGLMVEQGILARPVEPKPQPVKQAKKEKEAVKQEPKLDVAPEPPDVLVRMTRPEVEEAIREKRFDMTGKDLSGLDLSNLTFRNMDLSGSDLSQTRNENTIYDTCDARGTQFNEATFLNGAFLVLQADYAQFKGAHIAGWEIKKGDYYRADFTDAVFSNSPQRKAELPRKAEAPKRELREDATENVAPQEKQGRFSDALRRVGAFIKRHAERTYQNVAARWQSPYSDMGAASYQDAWQPAVQREPVAPAVERVEQPEKTVERAVPARPTVITGNSFRYANFQGARFEDGVELRDNDFNHADIGNTRFPSKAHLKNAQHSRTGDMDERTRAAREKALDKLAFGAERMSQEEFEKIPDALDKRADRMQDKHPGLSRSIAYLASANLMLKERANAVELEMEKLRAEANAATNPDERTATYKEIKELSNYATALKQSSVESKPLDPETAKLILDLKGDQGRYDALSSLGVFDGTLSAAERGKMRTALELRHDGLVKSPKNRDADPWQLWMDAAELVTKDHTRPGRADGHSHSRGRDSDQSQSRVPSRAMTRGR